MANHVSSSKIPKSKRCRFVHLYLPSVDATISTVSPSCASWPYTGITSPHSILVIGQLIQKFLLLICFFIILMAFRHMHAVSCAVEFGIGFTLIIVTTMCARHLSFEGTQPTIISFKSLAWTPITFNFFVS